MRIVDYYIVMVAEENWEEYLRIVFVGPFHSYFHLPAGFGKPGIRICWPLELEGKHSFLRLFDGEDLPKPVALGNQPYQWPPFGNLHNPESYSDISEMNSETVKAD